jgi:long-chain acyl-CoA synthetase
MSAQGTGIPALLAAQVAARPGAVALRSKRHGLWATVTYGELRDRVAALGAGLRTLGVQAGDPVALVAENSAAWIVADLAIQALGARSVALAPQTPSAIAARALGAIGAKVMICGDQEQVDLVLDHPDELGAITAMVVIDMTGMAAYEDPRLRRLADVEAAGRDAGPIDLGGADPDAETVVMFTAGTGGDPRPVAHTSAAVAEQARGVASWLGLSERDRLLAMLSLAMPTPRVTDVYAALAAGAEICLPEAPATIGEDLREVAPTVLTASPRALEVMRKSSERRSRESSRFRRRAYTWAMHGLGRRLDARDAARTPDGARRGRGLAWHLVGRFVARELGLLRTRRVVVTGGAVRSRDARFFWGLGVPVLEVYGQAELAGPALAQASLDDAGTIGRPLPGVDAKIAEDGALAVRTPATRGQWHTTDDLAEDAGDGRFRLRGRREHVVQTPAGEVVVAGLEAALCESAYIRRAVVGQLKPGTLTAIIEVDPDETAQWATERDLHFNAYSQLVAHPEVRNLIAAEVAAAKDRHGGSVGVDDFICVSEQLSVNAGQLTPGLTVRRAALLEQHTGDAGPAAGAEPAASAS